MVNIWDMQTIFSSSDIQKFAQMQAEQKGESLANFYKPQV